MTGWLICRRWRGNSSHGSNGLVKDVSESAVFIALQRYAVTLKPYYQVNPSDYLANLGLQSTCLS